MTIPPIPEGADRVVEAVVIAGLSWWRGKRGGKAEVLADIQKAASLAIADCTAISETLRAELAASTQRHHDCEANLAEVRQQVADMMRHFPPAPYVIDGLTGKAEG